MRVSVKRGKEGRRKENKEGGKERKATGRW